MKLAIVTTHPIQYNAPWFRLLAQQQNVDLKVFYTWEQSNVAAKYDPGFGKVIEWDLPLLEGYQYTFVKNISAKPGSHHAKGIINPSLNSDIEEFGAEAVLIFGWAFRSHMACMKYFKGKIPVLFRGDSTLLDEKPGLKRMLRRIYLKYVYSFIDYALYVGTNNKKYFIAHGLKDDQLVFVPHAIDNHRFIDNKTYFRSEALQWRKELGMNEDTFVVLFAGKFNSKKDPHFLLQLAKEIPGENIRFVLVGNGPLESELKYAASDNRVVFLDFQNQGRMPVVYHLCDVFVLPSKGPNETWGLAINEALACEKYVITTTRVGCAADMVKDNVNGIVIEPGDVHSAAQFVLSRAEQKQPDIKRQEANREILNIYSMDNIVNSISELLNTLQHNKK